MQPLTTTSPKKPGVGRGDSLPPRRLGVWQDHIPGRFRKITVHQLALAWWLYSAKHITKRQLRVYFAAHEMAERRAYTRYADRPLYDFNEIKSLVGGRGSTSADLALSADVRALGKLGMVRIMPHAIEFAVSVDQIAVDDVSGFWEFFNQLPNSRRTVPMPRRTCRALAAGFSSAVTAMTIALMIRTLFWHRDGGEEGQGSYRVDGRTKCSWISEVFGLSRRSVTEARARLVELGWITPLEAPQWLLNKYGQRYAINVGWKPNGADEPPVDQTANNAVNKPEEQWGAAGESASPNRDFSGEFASPLLNRSSSPYGESINTKRPAPMRAEPTGVDVSTKMGSRKKKPQSATREYPCLQDIQAEDLRNTSRLLELHRQAVEAGRIGDSEAGRLDFFALAERARAHGNRPAALFAWLLREKRFGFITQADEDAAAHRLRALRNGPMPMPRSRGDDPPSTKPRDIALTDDEQVVRTCILAAKRHRGYEPYDVARQVKGWPRDRWETAHASYQQKELDRWHDDKKD